MRPRICMLAALTLVAFAGVSPRSSSHAATVQDQASSSVWMTVDPTQPATIYARVGGTLMERSTDKGEHWQFLPQGAPHGDYGQSCNDDSSAPVVASDSHAIYVTYVQSTDPVCRTGVEGVIRSRDGGLTFEDLGSSTVFTLASPILSRRLYMAQGSNNGDYLSPPTCSPTISTRGPNDSSWKTREGPTGVDIYRGQACFDLVDDPTHPGVIYANSIPVTRSADGGMTWTQVVTPTTTPPLTDFSVQYDSAAGGLLEGVSGDAQQPHDRVFLSSDGGQTWTATTCPGDHNGTCPTAVLRNVFGPGASYALLPDGIYSFHGTGPAATRLSLSDHLPFSLKKLATLQGGTRGDNPVYALLQDGTLWRSDNAGRTWRVLHSLALPTHKLIAGNHVVGPYSHTIGSQFVATFHKLGVYVLGYPIDEPYLYGTILTQDFQHLRLEWRQHQVVIGDLGSEAAGDTGCGFGSDAPDGFCAQSAPVKAKPNSATYRFFPGTRHSLSGDMFRFWQQHGGEAVLGAPLTEVYRSENGDNSGRTYQMQLFTKARLERHPEIHNKRFAILLGLLGIHVLQDRGWLPSSHG